MDMIASINAALCHIVWGPPMMTLLLGVGLFLTIRTDCVQFRHFGYAMRHTLGKLFQTSQAQAGAVSPFQALTTALAATVGTGNIVGITCAVTLGGPGAVFWLWVSGGIGMVTKYAEVVLAVKYRKRNTHGDWVGGPMYYITGGLGHQWKWPAALFALFGALAAFGIGNAVQVSSITDAIHTAFSIFFPRQADRHSLNLAVGLIVAAIAAVTLLGGISRLGQITQLLIPFVSIAYITACIIVLICHARKLPAVFAAIIKGAFAPASVVGGVGGFTMKQCMEWGIKRGIFSNEAGLGSAPIAHAATSESDPVKQGFFGIFEVFADTIVICTISALTLLVSGIDLPYGTVGTTALNAKALGTVFGDELGALIIAVGITLFALATVLSWGLYGLRCCEYLLGSKGNTLYLWAYVFVILVGAVMEPSLVWEIADTLNGMMAIPNLIALVGLSGVVAKLTKEYFADVDAKK